jgi:hypothetical protein
MHPLRLPHPRHPWLDILLGVLLGLALLLIPFLIRGQSAGGDALLQAIQERERAREAGEPVIEEPAGLKPSTVLYWLDVIAERLGIWLADSTAEEIGLLLQYADEKLAEAEALAAPDPQAAAEATERYELYLEQAVAKASRLDASDLEREVLLTAISTALTLQLQQAAALAGQAGVAADEPYLEELFTVFADQQLEIYQAVQEPDRRENLLADFLAAVVATGGSPAFDRWRELLLARLREQANQQLDALKPALIRQIEEFSL